VTPDDLTRRLFLLDGSSLAYRAYFALPETIATRDGFPTNAIYGLSQMFLKIVTEYAPCAVVVAWDAREKTFRHEEYEGYKAQRPHMPDLLSMQWDRLPELVEAFGFVNLVKGGYEADDLLGTLAVAARGRGVKAAVVTGDRDSLQLVDDDIVVVATGRGITDVKVYTPARVVERFGVEPGQIPDFIGLKGDSSDNIPGVPGIGEKTAAALLQQFGSLEALYARLDEVASAKRRALLAEHEQTARLSKRLATMVRDVPLDEDLGTIVDRCDYRVPVAEVEDLFRRYEFTSLVRRLKETVAAPAGSGEDGGATTSGPGGATAPPVGAATARGAGGAASTAAGASRPASAPLPELVVERGAGALAAVLEQREAALAAVPAGDGGDGGAWAAAVFAGGDAVVAARVGAHEWPALWRLVAHVMAHDVKALPGFAGAPRGAAYDTAVAAYLLTPERAEKDRVLETLAGIDEAGPLFDGPADESAAATRAWLTWRVAGAQRPRLHELELDRLLYEIELPLTRVLALMEAAGVKVDTYRLGEITARLRERVEELTDTIHELAGETFTIGSPQQLAEVLFTRLGLEPSRKGKTGYSTDARVLRGLREQHPIVPAVEEWRELTKLLSTYLEPLPRRVDQRTGRLHTTFNQTVASTGRLSSSDPNLQNIPARTELGAEIRSCFVAEEGNLLVVADYSQIELRLMAKLSGEPALLDAYARGEDVHRVTAAAVAGIPVEEVTRTQREHAKATNFGIMYGLSAYGLSEQVGMPVDEAREFIEAYFARYPKVREFRDRVIAKATQDGYVTTLFGRRRPVAELKSSNYRLRSLGERLAVNSVLQGTAADIIKAAMIEVQRRLEGGGMAARLVLQVHDELVVEAPEAEVGAVKTLLGEAMRGAYQMEPVLEVEIGAGADWRGAK
jgi:DNA polymerase-1